MGAKRKIEIRKVSRLGIWITLFLALAFVFLIIQGENEFFAMNESTEQYIQGEKAAQQLEKGADYLTEQVRMYVMTGDTSYMDAYFVEANQVKSRENALDTFKIYFDRTASFSALKAALDTSLELMTTEYCAMRLVCEANDVLQSSWPDEIKAVELSKEDEELSDDEKIKKAQHIVTEESYQEMKDIIAEEVTNCEAKLIRQTRHYQGNAMTIFSSMYSKLQIGIVLMVILMIGSYVMIRRLIVKPLISYDESIKLGEILPVIGAVELQNLAVTYNEIYVANKETEKLIRHEAEHDPLTDLFNGGSFDKLIHIYETGESPFALILVDVDVFKEVNDTFGHGIGDQILRKVASVLKKQFRNIDYVCRIGGDEFAVIMVNSASDKRCTIKKKIEEANEELSNPTDSLPAVSLSVGVAFSDRKNPKGSISNDADAALYYIKEHGRHNCGFYE